MCWCGALTKSLLSCESLLWFPNLRSPSPCLGGARKPAEFLCLVLKLLQLQPDKEIIVEFIKNEDYKYVRVLGARRWHICRSVIS